MKRFSERFNNHTCDINGNCVAVIDVAVEIPTSWRRLEHPDDKRDGRTYVFTGEKMVSPKNVPSAFLKISENSGKIPALYQEKPFVERNLARRRW